MVVALGGVEWVCRLLVIDPDNSPVFNDGHTKTYDQKARSERVDE